MRKAALAAVLALVAVTAHAQTIYKCKDADGRVTYSSLACSGEGVPISKSGVPQVKTNAPEPGKAASADAPGAPPFPPSGAARIRQCDNSALLRVVVAKLDSPKTPDDARAFLADERFRLVRCEYARMSAAELREREAAIAEVDSPDAARRKAAMTRVLVLYERAARPPAPRP